ncbi:MAG: hydroxymethylbilane synthase [Proteobacteria bacterium]|nr:hydroxymethylbilane synthase [Pseudomonadota bacterium]
MERVRIGTRGSLLAMTQTNMVVELLQRHWPQLEVEIHQIKTSGDILYNQNLALVGGKGLFLKEIEEALLADQVDIAVHSMKDVPVDVHPDLEFSCCLEREDPRDIFISRNGAKLEDMPAGSVIGTCSTRRRAQLLRINSELQVVPLRGNVNTRLGKLQAGGMDGIVLALAGLKRLGLQEVINNAQIMGLDQMTPAVTQGIITIEHRRNDAGMAAFLAPLNHGPSMLRAQAERAYMEIVQGNCTTPAAGHAEFMPKESGSSATLMRFYAMYAGDKTSGEYKYVLHSGEGGAIEAARALGRQAGRMVLNA